MFNNAVLRDEIADTTLKDTSGGSKFRFKKVAADIRGSLQDANSAEVTDFDRRNMQITHVFLTRYSGFSKGHRAVEQSSGKTFDVKHAEKGRKFLSMGTFYIVFMEEMVYTDNNRGCHETSPENTCGCK